MKKLLALLLLVAICATFTFSAFATDDSDLTSEVTTGEETTMSDEEMQAMLDSLYGDGSTTTNDSQVVPAQTASLSGSTKLANIKGHNTSFLRPEEMTLVTMYSPESELTEVFGSTVTGSTFASYGYVFFAYNEDYSIVFQMVRNEDSYSKSVGNYSSLSAAQKEDIVNSKLAAEGTSSAEFVKYAGMNCIKTVAQSENNVQVTYQSVKDGQFYDIICYYNSAADSTTLGTVEKMINSLKTGKVLDINTVVNYALIAVVILLMVAFVLLYIKTVKLSKVIRAISNGPESYAINDGNPTANFTDGDFSFPYSPEPINGEQANDESYNDAPVDNAELDAPETADETNSDSDDSSSL